METLTPPTNSVPGQRVYVEGYDDQGADMFAIFATQYFINACMDLLKHTCKIETRLF